ncbi:hypothetical protein [Yersinia mollaretii]|uniref:hypothetical protein n=1 Tax=Yersinia mollaretii TaxID=33060 RepID=UPI0011A8CF3C|nr:hypothetical protein [Yersinia mollaretii]
MLYAIIDFILSLFGGIILLFFIILAYIIRRLTIIGTLAVGLLFMSKGMKNIFFDTRITEDNVTGAIAFIDTPLMGWHFSSRE